MAVVDGASIESVDHDLDIGVDIDFDGDDGVAGVVVEEDAPAVFVVG